jgi:predicted PurR-regulated permease PerM
LEGQLLGFFDGVRFRRFKLPHALSAIFTLIIIVGSIFCLASVFVPLIIHQAKVIASIDVNAISADMRLRLKGVQDVLHQYGILRYYENLDTVLISKAKEIVSLSSVSDVLGSIMNIAGNFFIGMFSVIFISFFFPER